MYYSCVHHIFKLHIINFLCADELVKDLRLELEHANELLDDARKKGLVVPTDTMIAEMSPSAAATSKLLKSGMTLTQIYSEYIRVSESLRAEKDENSRLDNNLNSIMMVCLYINESS